MDKYKKNWNVIKNKIGIKFYSEPIYDQRYIKAKLREFDGVIKTNFLGNSIPKENIYYTCIACVTIDSVILIYKKYFLQFYLKECKYKVKKRQMPRFINAELSDSDLDSNSESEYDTVS